MLLALFLLLAVRAPLVHRPVDPLRVNAKRSRLGRVPLLEHIEVSAPLFAQAERWHGEHDGNPRRGPRLRHVRGTWCDAKRDLLARPALARSRASRPRAAARCSCSCPARLFEQNGARRSR